MFDFRKVWMFDLDKSFIQNHLFFLRQEIFGFEPIFQTLEM